MNQIEEMIATQAQRYGLPLAPGQTLALVQFLELLQKWGRTLRLTADPRPQVMVKQHLPDALVLARLLSALQPCPETAIDVGSGAGLPALPLAVLTPEISYTLVESRSRRCSFLQTAIHQLKLNNCRVINSRLEQTNLPPMDLAMSKATFPPPVWLKTAAELVHSGGYIALLCSSPEHAPEHLDGLKKLQRTGFQSYAVRADAPRIAALYQCFT